MSMICMRRSGVAPELQHLFIAKTELINRGFSMSYWNFMTQTLLKYCTVKILKFGTPQTIAIIVLKLVKFDVTLH